MRYPLIIGMSIFALPFLVVASLYVAISVAVGMAVGATVTGVSTRKRHQNATAELIRTQQGELRTAFWLGIEAHKRRRQQ